MNKIQDYKFAEILKWMECWRLKRIRGVCLKDGG